MPPRDGPASPAAADPAQPQGKRRASTASPSLSPTATASAVGALKAAAVGGRVVTTLRRGKKGGVIDEASETEAAAASQLEAAIRLARRYTQSPLNHHRLLLS